MTRARNLPLCFLAALAICCSVAAQGGPPAGKAKKTEKAAKAGQPADKTEKKEKAATGQPRLCVAPDLIADPTTNTASAWLEFCADEKTPLRRLTVGDFVSRTTHFALGARPLFFGPNDTAGKPAYPLPALVGGETTLVRLEVSNLWEAGEYEAQLQADGKPIAQIKGIKYRLPFGVKLDSPSAEKPEVRFERRRKQEVALKNDDDVTYAVKWELTLEGSTFCGETELSPKGSAIFKIEPSNKWFSWTSLLKDDDLSGKLSLAFAPPRSANDPHWPHKVISFTAHLSYATGFRRDFASFLAVFVLLSLGALVSFLGHVALPNRIERSRLKEELDDLARRTGGVSRLVDSRLRVLVGVERETG